MPEEKEDQEEKHDEAPSESQAPEDAGVTFETFNKEEPKEIQ